MSTEDKIQLMHPEGKHAFRIDAGKYDVMSKAILQVLKKGPLMHKEMHAAILAYFKKNKIKFEGAAEWYMEGVKLDLEARNSVIRVKENSKLKFQLNEQTK